MPRVLVAGRVHEAGLDILRAAPDVTLDLVDEVSTAAYAPFVADADAVLIRTQPMPASIIEQAPRLKIVSRHGVGFDAVDVAALNRRKIPLAIVGDVNSRPVAEHTMMLILALAKRIFAYDDATRRSAWTFRNRFEATELDGKTLLLFGLGRIGRRVATLARAFDMRVVAHDPYLGADAVRAVGVEPVSDLDAAIGAADVISVHVPFSSGAVIGAAEIARMKPSAILVNTARGGLIDEAALTAALSERRIAGAGIDVFVEEPPPNDHPLLASDHVVVTPHSASLTEECAARMSIAAARNILDFFAGRLDPALVVNKAGIA